MQRLKPISGASVRSLALLFGICGWVALGDDVASKGADSNRRAPFVNGDESITVDGVNYNQEGASRMLVQAFSSGDDKRKLRFLGEIKKFGRTIPVELIGRLKTEFPKERNPEVRGGILELVMHSQDAQMKDFCQLAKEDSDSKVRALAGAWLLDNGQVSPVTESVPPAVS